MGDENRNDARWVVWIDRSGPGTPVRGYLSVGGGIGGDPEVVPLERACRWTDLGRPSAERWAEVVGGRVILPPALEDPGRASGGDSAWLPEVLLALERERALVRSLEGLVGDLVQLGRRAAAAADASVAMRAERLEAARSEARAPGTRPEDVGPLGNLIRRR